jgi:hypothetical protein
MTAAAKGFFLETHMRDKGMRGAARGAGIPSLATVYDLRYTAVPELIHFAPNRRFARHAIFS